MAAAPARGRHPGPARDTADPGTARTPPGVAELFRSLEAARAGLLAAGFPAAAGRVGEARAALLEDAARPDRSPAEQVVALWLRRHVP